MTVQPSGGMNVTIIDQRSAKAPPIEQRWSRGADGREVLTAIIRETIAGPDVSGDLETRYGLRRQLTRR